MAAMLLTPSLRLPQENIGVKFVDKNLSHIPPGLDIGAVLCDKLNQASTESGLRTHFGHPCVFDGCIQAVIQAKWDGVKMSYGTWGTFLDSLPKELRGGRVCIHAFGEIMYFSG